MVLGNIDISCVICGGIHVIAISIGAGVGIGLGIGIGIGVGIGIGIGTCVGIGIGIGIYSGVGIGKLDSCWSSGHCQVPAVVIGQRGQCDQFKTSSCYVWY